MVRKLFIFVILSPVVFCLNSSQDLDDFHTGDRNYFYTPPDYYWRDHKSQASIPLDAVIGGKTLNNQAFYIGRCRTKDPLSCDKTKTSPCPITPKSRQLDNGTEIVQILCSSNPKQLKWLDSDTGNELELLDGNEGVVVNSTPEKVDYVARMTMNNAHYLTTFDSCVVKMILRHYYHYKCEILVISGNENSYPTPETTDDLIIQKHKRDYKFLRQLTKNNASDVF